MSIKHDISTAKQLHALLRTIPRNRALLVDGDGQAIGVVRYILPARRARVDRR